MKTLDNMSDDELVALTSAEIQRFVDLECAKNGISLLPHEPVAPKRVAHEPDVNLYSVEVYGPLCFASMDEAQRVLDAISGCERLSLDYMKAPGCSTSKVVAGKETYPVKIERLKAFSQRLSQAISVELATAAELEEEYLKAKKEFDSVVNDRRHIVDSVSEKVACARGRINRRRTLEALYQRYLELAEGNLEIAANFLENACSDARTFLPHVFDSFAARVAADFDESAA